MPDVNVSDFAVASIKGENTVNNFWLGELGFESPEDAVVPYEDIESFVTQSEIKQFLVEHCLGGDCYLARRVSENGKGTFPFSEDTNLVFEPLLTLTKFIGRVSAKRAVR